jgi:arylsulfatase A-like enzyme
MHPLRGAKGMLYEGGIREPLIVRWPNRIQAGSRCATPVMGIDFYPTFLAMMGDQHLPGQVLDGQNLLPLLEQRGEIPREALFWHFPAYLESYKDGIGPWRTTPASAIRLGDYKLIEFFEEGTLELYNIQDDPGETTNLAQTLPSKRDELHARLKAWQYAIKAPIPRQKNPEYQPPEN